MIGVLNEVMPSLGAALAEGQGFMDTLPDPMKLDWKEILFAMGVVVVLHLVLKRMFFRPVLATMEARDAAIDSGAARRAEVAAMVAQGQDEYERRLKELRQENFERRKTLAEGAAMARQELIEKARAQGAQARSEALQRLTSQGEAARAELMGQVEHLAETMVQQLLKA